MFCLRSISRLIVAGIAVMSSSILSVNAAPVAYTDRALFEAALDSFTIDPLNGIPSGFVDKDIISRSNYTIGVDLVYGCVNLAGCDGSGIDGDNSYLWTYGSANPNLYGSADPNNFVFDSQINGFGFDFNNPNSSTPSNAILAGVNSPNTSGFFGIIDNVPFTSISQFMTLPNTPGLNYMWIDNITYGSSINPVPVPAAVWLFGSALIGLLGVGKRRKTA